MPTIADVAAAAGVSISTVSYVMSGKRTISQETRERVEQAIEQLNYSPHASARSLASRATNVIGLQAPLRSGVDVHVVMEIVAGMVQEARANRYDLLLLTDDRPDTLTRATRGSQVDALLVMDVESDDPRITTLAELDTPSVLVGLPTTNAPITCVDFDFEAAGRLAATRLIELGNTRIALVAAPAEVLERHTSYADRLVAGFLAAAEEHGVTASVHPCPSDAEAVPVITQLLEEHPDITGVLLHNEGALPHVAPRLIGDDTRQRDVIALCPADLSRSVPGLADAIDIPASSIGVHATRTLLQLLDGVETARVQLLPPALQSATTTTATATTTAAVS